MVEVERRNKKVRIIWNVYSVLALALWVVTITASRGRMFAWSDVPVSTSQVFLSWRMLAVVILLAAMIGMGGTKLNPVRLLALISGLWAALVVIAAIGGGLHSYRAMLAVANVLAIGFPMVSAGVTALLLRREKASYAAQVIGAGVMGIAAAMVLPWAGVILSCGLAGLCP